MRVIVCFVPKGADEWLCVGVCGCALPVPTLPVYCIYLCLCLCPLCLPSSTSTILLLDSADQRVYTLNFELSISFNFSMILLVLYKGLYRGPFEGQFVERGCKLFSCAQGLWAYLWLSEPNELILLHLSLFTVCTDAIVSVYRDLVSWLRLSLFVWTEKKPA